jgi:hypothetical protein
LSAGHACCYDAVYNVVWTYDPRTARISVYRNQGIPAKPTALIDSLASNRLSPLPATKSRAAPSTIEIALAQVTPYCTILQHMIRIAYEYSPSFKSIGYCINVPTPIKRLPFCMELTSQTISLIAQFLAELIESQNTAKAYEFLIVVRLWLYYYKHSALEDKEQLKSETRMSQLLCCIVEQDGEDMTDNHTSCATTTTAMPTMLTNTTCDMMKNRIGLQLSGLFHRKTVLLGGALRCSRVRAHHASDRSWIRFLVSKHREQVQLL